MPGRFGGNPHPALLPIFLMMSHPGGEPEKMLDDLIDFIQSTKAAVQAMKNGVETFQAGMLKMIPSAKPKEPVSTLPDKKSYPTPEEGPEKSTG
ncbi:MAG: hypothetical protein K6T65_06280 [Peptococcaceae bacterium]|nr:hypothetical protein [Peptococcaceae bacterium]